MKTILYLTIMVLIFITIYQAIQIKKLRKQTIEAFKKLCEKVFSEDD